MSGASVNGAAGNAPPQRALPSRYRCGYLRCQRLRSRGMSLSELVAVMGMVAITAAVAAPNLNAIVQGQQLRVAASDLYSAIQLTRSQAIARNERVILTTNDDAGADWSRGWTVYVDRDDDRDRKSVV